MASKLFVHSLETQVEMLFNHVTVHLYAYKMPVAKKLRATGKHPKKIDIDYTFCLLSSASDLGVSLNLLEQSSIGKIWTNARLIKL